MAQLKRSYAMHGGEVRQYTHRSRETGTDMRFTVYLPPAAAIGPVPALYYLSGLTCTDDNFTQKAGAQRFASQQGIALIAPDTSPRGAGVAGEDDAYDFGSGAGWYVDATAAPWSRNYRMYSYVTKELPALAEDTLPLLRGVRSIMGHSMGGHGALTIAMREKGAYASVSAFAPICAPTKCPWGQKAFKGYFGDVGVGAAHDATELMLARGPFPELGTILVDQGTEDEFYSGATNQLRPADFEAACQKAGQGLELRYSAGGHDYFYIATLIDQHVAHHAKALRRRAAEQAAPAPPVAAPAAQPSTAGKPIKCRAAVAYAAKQPLKTVEITVAPPRRGEVRVKVICNALCHTDVHPQRAGPRGALPLHPGARGRHDSGVRWRGRHHSRPWRPRGAVLHPPVQRAELHLLHELQDQPLPQDTRHAGQGRHAGRHYALHRPRRGAHLPLHGLQHLQRVHGARRDLLRQGQPHDALPARVPLRLRAEHRAGRGLEHHEGRDRCNGRRLRPGCGGARRHSGGQGGRRPPHFRNRPEQEEVPDGAGPGGHGLPLPQRLRQAHAAGARRRHTVGRGLHLRLHG
eukprot:TRINITY_DN751_c0_g1_i8.p1 TRINITY_DN751_c0_g1~~TRINITY_DN751_c0_g1_i8.p1  ORF type:complete len:612 (+),score=81.10 TRINITY_DN751_c0_g1_i8:109-1836(+)